MTVDKINSIKINSERKVRNQVQRDRKNKTSFNGGMDLAFDLLDKGFSILDKNAMIQVSFVDTVSTNIPRTLVDLKTGLAAAFETCRREFSGLFVNCLMPGLIVKGIAEILSIGSKELKETKPANSWANGKAIDNFKEFFKQAQESDATDKTREYVQRVISSLEGLEGKTWVKYADKANLPEFQEAVSQITSAITANGSDRKKLLQQAQKKLVSITKAENILRLNGNRQSNLTDTLRDVVDLGARYNSVTEKITQELDSTSIQTPEIKAKIAEAIDKYSSNLKGFVNKKSIIGMIIVLGIAVSVQTINRAITRKQFNAEGAPIYKDFGKKDTTQKMDEKQKKQFFLKKLASAIGMYSLAAISMMKKPSLGMFQFSSIFPTLDQCRWIAASTFASRMMGAEDENELRETTVRDLASFSGLYFLGDYVKKGAASAIEALSKTNAGKKLFGENVVLLNRSKEISKPILDKSATVLEKATSNIFYRLQQAGNWIKNTDLKTAAEVSSVKVRNLRNICRVADIAFSIIMLGILLPKHNRKVTERKVEQAKKLEAQKQQNLFLLEKTPEIFKELI